MKNMIVETRKCRSCNGYGRFFVYDEPREKIKVVPAILAIIAIIVLLFFLSLAQAQAQIPTCVNALAASPQGPFPCSISLTWQDNSTDETTFIIERQLNGGTWTQLNTVATNITTYVDATATQSSTVDNNYCYQVKAGNVDANGKPQSSSPTPQSSTTCKVIPKKVVVVNAPSAPSGLTVTMESVTAIRMSWANNSTNETSFDLKRTTGQPPLTTIINGIPKGTTLYFDENLIALTTYCYQVRAVNSKGASNYSVQSCGTTLSR